jgi:hypothetical protein
MSKHDEMAREIRENSVKPAQLSNQYHVSIIHLEQDIASALAQVEAETLDMAARFMERRAAEIEGARANVTASTIARIYRDEATAIRSLTINEKLTPAKLADEYVRVPMTGWKQDGNLLYRLKEGSNYDEINVSQAKGSRMLQDRTKRAAELLAMIQAAPDTDISVSGGLIEREQP